MRRGLFNPMTLSVAAAATIAAAIATGDHTKLGYSHQQLLDIAALLGSGESP